MVTNDIYLPEDCITVFKNSVRQNLIKGGKSEN